MYSLRYRKGLLRSAWRGMRDIEPGNDAGFQSNINSAETSMNASFKSLAQTFAAVVMMASLAAVTGHAKQGATDPIPGTSKGATNSGGGGGGGGGKSSTPPAVTPPAVVLPPAPPAAPYVNQTLAFTPVSPVNGVDPVCTGGYHIDPYYPTLSLMTVSVETSSVNAPDGTPLYVSVTGTGGTLYPFTSNVISTIGGYGLVSYSVYVTPGTVITAVNISDASGKVIASGQ